MTVELFCRRWETPILWLTYSHLYNYYLNTNSVVSLPIKNVIHASAYVSAFLFYIHIDDVIGWFTTDDCFYIWFAKSFVYSIGDKLIDCDDSIVINNDDYDIG